MDCSTPGFPILHYFPEFAQVHVYRVGEALQPSRPRCTLLLLLSIFPSIRFFSNESALCIKWPKYWSFSFSILPLHNSVRSSHKLSLFTDDPRLPRIFMKLVQQLPQCTQTPGSSCPPDSSANLLSMKQMWSFQLQLQKQISWRFQGHLAGQSRGRSGGSNLSSLLKASGSLLSLSLSGSPFFF